jgi:hypothetical protein
MEVKVFLESGDRLQLVISEWLEDQGPQSIDIISVTQSGEADFVTVTIFYRKSYSERD